MPDKIPPLPPENLPVEYRLRPNDCVPLFGSDEHMEEFGPYDFHRMLEYQMHSGD